MSDTGLTDSEADRLRELLHRAADSIDVTTPAFDTVTANPEPGRNRPGRWIAVAAVLVVAATGATWWLTAVEEDRIETGPADAPVAVAPEVLEQPGIWRLPEGLDDHRVAGAMTSSSTQPVLLAVDDIDEPNRWLALSNWGAEIPLDDLTQVVELPDDLELILRPVDGEDGITRFGLRDTNSSGYLTGTFRGVDEADVIETLSDGFTDAATLSDDGRRQAAIQNLRLPDGLTATWDSGSSPMDPLESVTVTLVDDDGAAIMVVLGGTGLPPAVTALRHRLGELEMSSTTVAGQPVTRLLERRDDLGPHVLQTTSLIDGLPAGPGGLGLVVITADGTTITATRAADPDDLVGTEPLDEAEQLRVINSLRSMTAEEFRDTVERLGGEFVDPNTDSTTPGVVTTLQGNSDGTVTTTTVP